MRRGRWLRFRARWLFAWDTSMLVLSAERELSAASRVKRNGRVSFTFLGWSLILDML